MKKKENYYLIDEHTGNQYVIDKYTENQRNESIFTGTHEDALQAAADSISRPNRNVCIEGRYIRVEDHFSKTTQRCRLQTVAEYDAQKEERQEMLATVEAIQKVVDMADKMKYAYFWEVNENRANRKRYDEYHSAPKVCWTDNGHEYSAEFCTTSSRQNVYTKGYYYKDGKATNLKAIRYSCDRMWDQYFKKYSLGKYADCATEQEKQKDEEKPEKKKRRSRSL